jgi:hypothetical protein
VTERRIRQIVADVLRREKLDDTTDHALLQLVRLERAHALAAEAGRRRPQSDRGSSQGARQHLPLS